LVLLLPLLLARVLADLARLAVTQFLVVLQPAAAERELGLTPILRILAGQAAAGHLVHLF
jgi:hypothetical protein